MSVNSIGTSAALSTIAAAQTQPRKPVGEEANEGPVQKKPELPKPQASDSKLGSRIDTFA